MEIKWLEDFLQRSNAACIIRPTKPEGTRDITLTDVVAGWLCQQRIQSRSGIAFHSLRQPRGDLGSEWHR